MPGARHRDAAAIEMKSPTFEQWKTELEADGANSSGAGSSAAGTTNAPSSPGASAQGAERTPQRVIVKSPLGSSSPKPPPKDALESEILIVVSKLKNYVRERSEMNTSDSVANVLSDRVRRLCDRAIEKARADGRKTVMDRDFE